MNDSIPRAVLIERPGPVGINADRVAGAFLAGYRSEATRYAYRYDLHGWFEFCGRYQLHPIEGIRRSHVEIYARELQGSGLAVATQARRISTLKAFFGWCFDEEIVEGNPAGRVKAVKVTRPDMPSMTKSQLHRFLLATEAEPRLYERAVVLLLALTGVRVSEATGADIRDLVVREWVPTLRVDGKGEKPRSVVVPPRAMVAVETALEGRKVGPLLLNRAGNRMTRINVARVITRISKAAGLEDLGLSPHALRRTYAEVALGEMKNPRDVQLALGHTSIDTTMYYDRREMTPDRSPSWAVQSAIA